MRNGAVLLLGLSKLLLDLEGLVALLRSCWLVFAAIHGGGDAAVDSAPLPKISPSKNWRYYAQLSN